MASVALLTLMVAMVPAEGAGAQEGYTDLPLGLSLSQVLIASGLPLDHSDAEGWTSQEGGGQAGPGALPVHYSAVESSNRFPGVSPDSVRTALEATLRSELEARGARIVERPPRPGRPVPGEGQGDAWTFPWRAPEARSRGWVTMLVLPDEEERVRLMVVSVEVREGGG